MTTSTRPFGSTGAGRDGLPHPARTSARLSATSDLIVIPHPQEKNL
jgi:hypothetical protein